jgi:hypothetical protein
LDISPYAITFLHFYFRITSNIIFIKQTKVNRNLIFVIVFTNHPPKKLNTISPRIKVNNPRLCIRLQIHALPMAHNLGTSVSQQNYLCYNPAPQSTYPRAMVDKPLHYSLIDYLNCSTYPTPSFEILSRTVLVTSWTHSTRRRIFNKTIDIHFPYSSGRFEESILSSFPH